MPMMAFVMEYVLQVRTPAHKVRRVRGAAHHAWNAPYKATTALVVCTICTHTRETALPRVPQAHTLRVICAPVATSPALTATINLPVTNA